MRDQRDPQLLGERLLEKRKGIPGELLSSVADVADLDVPDYSSDVMSNDPAEHHSKTPQDAPVVPDGDPS